MSAPPPATAEERVVADADTAADAVGPGRRWRPGATTGVVAAAPSAAAAMGSALFAACGSCVGLGSAAAGAATGAAAGGGLPGWQIGFVVAVFAVLIAVQLRRALAASRTRCVPGGRTRFVLQQLAPSLLAGAVAFAAVQVLVVPWLAAPPVPAGPTLP